MVEVFKTNVECPHEAAVLVKKLARRFPLYRINFDVEDSDHVLRVQGDGIAPCVIIELLGEDNFECALLD